MTATIDPTAAVDPAHREARAKLAQPVMFTGYEREEGDSEIAAIVRVEVQGEGDRARKVRRARRPRGGRRRRSRSSCARRRSTRESGGQVGDVGERDGGRRDASR